MMRIMAMHEFLSCPLILFQTCFSTFGSIADLLIHFAPSNVQNRFKIIPMLKPMFYTMSSSWEYPKWLLSALFIGAESNKAPNDPTAS